MSCRILRINGFSFRHVVDNQRCGSNQPRYRIDGHQPAKASEQAENRKYPQKTGSANADERHCGRSRGQTVSAERSGENLNYGIDSFESPDCADSAYAVMNDCRIAVENQKNISARTHTHDDTCE